MFKKGQQPPPGVMSLDVIQSGERMVCRNCGETEFFPKMESIFVSRLNPKNNQGKDVVTGLNVGLVCLSCGFHAALPVLKKTRDKFEEQIAEKEKAGNGDGKKDIYKDKMN